MYNKFIPKYILIDMMGKMYLEEGKTAQQIADETGYSINTVRKYLVLGHYYKQDLLKTNNKKENSKTKKYKKLTREEILELFRNSKKSKQ